MKYLYEQYNLYDTVYEHLRMRLQKTMNSLAPKLPEGWLFISQFCIDKDQVCFEAYYSDTANTLPGIRFKIDKTNKVTIVKISESYSIGFNSTKNEVIKRIKEWAKTTI